MSPREHNFFMKPIPPKNVVIIGASGHGSVVLDCILKEGKYNVIGFVDNIKKEGRYHCGYKILGNEYNLPHLVDKYNLHGGIIAIGDNWVRKKVFDKITQIVPNFNFISTVHPDASIGLGVSMGKGTVIMPGAHVNVNCKIGDFCIVNTNSSIDHDGEMGQYASIAPGCCAGGNVSLGAFSAICLGTNVIENITIAEQTIIGAGSLVVSDIEDHVVAYGSPAKIIRQRIPGDSYLGAKRHQKIISLVSKGF